MKKVLYIVIGCLFINNNLSAQDLAPGVDASVMIGYWSVKESTKLGQAAVMIKGLKESVEMGAGVAKSLQSLQGFYEQLREDQNSIASFEEMKAQYLDQYLEEIKNDFDNGPLIDFYSMYMNTTSKYRNGNGSINLVGMFIENVSSAGGDLDNVLQDVSGSYSNINNNYMSTQDELYANIIRSQAAGRAIHYEEIRQLEKQARNFEAQAYLIHGKVNAGMLGIGIGMQEQNFADNESRLVYKRSRIADLQQEQEAALDSAASKRRRIQYLKSKPLNLGNYETEFLEKVNAINRKKANVLRTHIAITDIPNMKDRWN